MQLLDALIRTPEAASVLTHATETPTAQTPTAETPAGTPPAVAAVPARRPRQRLALTAAAAAAAAGVAAVLAGTSYLALSPCLAPDQHSDQAASRTGDGRHPTGVSGWAFRVNLGDPSGGPVGTPIGGATAGPQPTATPGGTHRSTTAANPPVKLPNPTKWRPDGDTSRIGYAGIPLRGGAIAATADLQVCVWEGKCTCSGHPPTRGTVSWTTHVDDPPTAGRISFQLTVYTCAGVRVNESGNPLTETAASVPPPAVFAATPSSRPSPAASVPTCRSASSTWAWWGRRPATRTCGRTASSRCDGGRMRGPG